MPGNYIYAGISIVNAKRTCPSLCAPFAAPPSDQNHSICKLSTSRVRSETAIYRLSALTPCLRCRRLNSRRSLNSSARVVDDFEMYPTSSSRGTQRSHNGATLETWNGPQVRVLLRFISHGAHRRLT